MKLNLVLLPQLLCAIHKVSGGLHLSKTTAQRTQNDSFIANFLQSVSVKEFQKSAEN